IGIPAWRVLRYPPLDVCHDPALRIVQVVTSVQQGGAERIALSLAEGLAGRRIRSLLVTLGRPTRSGFPVPAGIVDVSAAPGGKSGRADAAASAALEFAADLVHGHLLDAEDVARFSAHGLPLLLTIHNVRAGWPRGLETLRAADAALLAACSRAVE